MYRWIGEDLSEYAAGGEPDEVVLGTPEVAQTADRMPTVVDDRRTYRLRYGPCRRSLFKNTMTTD